MYACKQVKKQKKKTGTKFGQVYPQNGEKFVREEKTATGKSLGMCPVLEHRYIVQLH